MDEDDDEEELLEVWLDGIDVDVISCAELETELDLEVIEETGVELEIMDEAELDLEVIDEEDGDENDVEDAMDLEELEDVEASEIARATYPAYIREPLSIPGVYRSPVMLDNRRQLLLCTVLR